MSRPLITVTATNPEDQEKANTLGEVLNGWDDMKALLDYIGEDVYGLPHTSNTPKHIVEMVESAKKDMVNG